MMKYKMGDLIKSKYGNMWLGLILSLDYNPVRCYRVYWVKKGNISFIGQESAENYYVLASK